MDGLPVPHEILAMIAQCYLSDPRDRLNLILTCMEHKDRLLDGTNGAHTFRDVEFFVLFRARRWSLLQFRKFQGFKQFDVFFVLSSPDVPRALVERMMPYVEHLHPPLIAMLRAVLDDDRDRVISATEDLDVLSDTTMRVLLLWAIRSGAKWTLARLAYIKYRAVEAHRKLSEWCRNRFEKLAWDIALELDDVWAFKMLNKLRIPLDVTQNRPRVGPRLAPGVCTVPGRTPIFAYFGLRYGLVRIRDLSDDDMRYIVPRATRSREHQMLEEIIRIRPGAIGELKKALRKYRSFSIRDDPDFRHVRFCLCENTRQAEKFLERDRFAFTLAFFGRVARGGPHHLVPAVARVMGDHEHRKSILYAARNSFDRVGLLWKPEFGDDVEILLAGVRSRGKRHGYRNFLKLFNPVAFIAARHKLEPREFTQLILDKPPPK